LLHVSTGISTGTGMFIR